MIAYFILVHRYPEQFKRLFKAIYNPNNHYLIHIDKKSAKELSTDITTFLAKYPNTHLLKSQNVVWGGYSMVDVELKAIKYLLKLSSQWQFFINLSGQDFPLKTQKSIMQFLKENKTSSFMKIANQIQDRPNTLNRIYNYFEETNNGFIGTPIKRNYLATTTPYIGGQWKILTRECCAFLSTSPKVAKFRTFYKNTLIPDESFFQTVLMNTNYMGQLVNDDKRAIIWIPDLGPKLLAKKFTANMTNALVASGQIKLRPKTLTKNDLSFLLKSTALFARKLDSSIDPLIFDALEKEMMPRKPKTMKQRTSPVLISDDRFAQLLPLVG